MLSHRYNNGLKQNTAAASLITDKPWLFLAVTDTVHVNILGINNCKCVIHMRFHVYCWKWSYYFYNTVVSSIHQEWRYHSHSVIMGSIVPDRPQSCYVAHNLRINTPRPFCLTCHNDGLRFKENARLWYLQHISNRDTTAIMGSITFDTRPSYESPLLVTASRIKWPHILVNIIQWFEQILLCFHFTEHLQWRYCSLAPRHLDINLLHTL